MMPRNLEYSHIWPLRKDKMKKEIRSFLLSTGLFFLLLIVWFYQKSPEREITKENSKQLHTKTQLSKTIDIPVIVETIKSPKKKKEIKTVSKKQQPVTNKNLIKNKNKSNGSSDPNFFAKYQLPVREYLQFMRSRGGRIFIYDQMSERFICELDENDNLLSLSDINGMSRRTRRITDDYPYKRDVLNKVERLYGPGSYEILLLLPKSLERTIYENIRRVIAEKGLNMEDVTTVFMTYRGDNHSLFVYVEKVTGRFGIIKIGRTFRL